MYTSLRKHGDITRNIVEKEHTVYLFGAGVNRVIKSPATLGVPPLAFDFFKEVLRSQAYCNIDREMIDLFNFIEEFWKYSVDDLREERVWLNLEECYTLIQMKAQKALSEKSREAFVHYQSLSDSLTSLLTHFLSLFEPFIAESEELLLLAKAIVTGNASVLTFNYDCLLERAIEAVSSGVGSPSWKREQAYGINFVNNVPFALRNTNNALSSIVPCKDFYIVPFLKLHGSLNWYTPDETIYDRNDGKVLGQCYLIQLSPPMNSPLVVDGVRLKPVLITPVLHKDYSKVSIINHNWERAKVELSSCRKLVIIGYSFPPTDYYTRMLFLEAFRGARPSEVITVNPDSKISAIAASLCHCPVSSVNHFNSLWDFINSH